MSTHRIRTAQPEDASELARLLTALGHASTEEEVLTRWRPWQAAGGMAIVVEGADGGLIGAATLHQSIVLHRPTPIGRISALIVDPRHQGKGLGRALVEKGERILREAGCGLIEITSNMRRTEAHAFYAHLGYELTSSRFVKTVNAV